jgi:hypothetical protein
MENLPKKPTPETVVPNNTRVFMAALDIVTNTALIAEVLLEDIEHAEKANWTLVRPDSSVKSNEMN